MRQSYGSQTMVGRLRRVMVRRPDGAFGSADPTRWHYAAQPVLNDAQAEHDALVATLRAAGAEVIYHDEPLADHADAIFVHDPVLVTDRGALVLRMGKALRTGEEAAIARSLERAGVPVYATINGAGQAEGGDLLWLDHDTLAAGVGFRTNEEGVRQLRKALQPLAVQVLTVPLPYFQGPEACLHLMSFISIVGERLAVVYLPLLPVPFFQLLVNAAFGWSRCPTPSSRRWGRTCSPWRPTGAS